MALRQGQTRAKPGPDQGHDDPSLADLAPVGTRLGPGLDLVRDQEARVVHTFLAGDAPGTIADELAGMRDRKSGAWKRARAQVEGIIREELRQALADAEFYSEIVREGLRRRREQGAS